MRRDLLTTVFGIGAGQAVLLVAMPFLARQFGPAAFGSYSVIVAVAGVIATIAALRLDFAVTSARDENVAPLAKVAVALPLVVVPLAILVLAGLLALPMARHWSIGPGDLPAIGLIALFQGIVLAANGLATRRGAFALLAITRIVQPLIFAALALSIVPSLPIAMALGWGAALLCGGPLIFRTKVFGVRAKVRDAMLASWRFPAISAPMALLDVLALALPLLFIAATFGDVSAGNYAQVQRLVGAPLTLVATATAQVFFKYAGDIIRSGGHLMPFVRKVAMAMAGLSVLMAVVVLTIGHPVLAFLVGPGWRTDAGFLLLALMPVLFRVVASPISSVLVLTNRLRLVGQWQISYFVVTLLILLAAQRFLTFEGTLAVFACSEFVMYAAYLYLSFGAARRFDDLLGSGIVAGNIAPVGRPVGT